MKKKLHIIVAAGLMATSLMLVGCDQGEKEAEKMQLLSQMDVEFLGQANKEDLKAEHLVDMSQCTGWASVPGDGLEGVTGGGDVEPQIVTTIDELRQLAEGNEPRVIVIDGMITSEGMVSVGSNKTIVGIDHEATLQGGFQMNDVANIIISNLNIDSTARISHVVDGIAAKGTHHLWLDHLNIWNASDGLMDLTYGSDYLTVSWCKFSYTSSMYEHRLSSLVGSGTGHDETDVGKLNATYHHNWFSDFCTQRMPRVLYGKGHVFNNFYDCPRNDYCIGVGSYASVLIENNYFKDVNNPHQFMYNTALPAAIVARGNEYENTNGNQDSGHGGIGYGHVDLFDNPSYDYTLDNAYDVPQIVTTGAGPRDLTATFEDNRERLAAVETEAPKREDKPILYDEATDTYTYQGQMGDGSNAAYEIDNPFAGSDLHEEKTVTGKAPYWEKGVTISYWVYLPKYAEDAPILNFNLENDRQMSNWDAWKYNVCKAYDKDKEEYSFGKKATYVDKEGNEYTVLENYGKYVTFHPDYPKEGCYYVDEKKGIIPVYKKGEDKKDESNWTYIRYIGDGQYKGYNVRFDEEGGEESLISEAEIDGSLSLYASGTVGYRQDNGTGIELNPNLPGYGHIAPIQVYNQFYYWGNGGQLMLDDSELKTPTMEEKEKWHFVVAIIKNDYVQYYMDGKEMTVDYLNWWEDEAWDMNVGGAAFNLGYGMSKNYRTSNPSEIWSTGKTILDFISDENTVLTVGGIGCGAKVLGQHENETVEGVQVKEITFYDQPIDGKFIQADKIDTDIQPLD